MDIFNTNDASAVKFPKIFASSYIFASFYNLFGGVRNLVDPQVNHLDRHKMATSADYVKQTTVGSGLRAAYHITKGPSAIFAVFSTSYFFLVSKFKDYEYSRSQSYLRASAIIAPIAVFFVYDRPFANFWYRSAFFGIFICNTF